MDHRLARTAVLLNQKAGARHLPPVWQFTDPVRLPDPLRAINDLPSGSGMVFRHFGDTAYRSLGPLLRDRCRERGLVFLVGSDVDLAAALNADGIHLPERMAAEITTVRAARPKGLITAAAHSLNALRLINTADAVFVSPVFWSDSPSAGAPIGARLFSEWVSRISYPVYALGGVNADTASKLLNSGCAGIAGISFGV